MSKKPKVTNEQIAEVLLKNMGNISAAASALNITRQCCWQRINKSKKLQKVQNEARESTLDLAEHKLLKKINSEDLGAICFFLKCQGKSRGYVERQEIDLTDRTIAVKLPDDMKDDE